MGAGGESPEDDLQHCCIQHLLCAGGWGGWLHEYWQHHIFTCLNCQKLLLCFKFVFQLIKTWCQVPVSVAAPQLPVLWITAVVNSQVLTLTSFIYNSGSIDYSTQSVLVCSVLPKHLLPQYGVVFFAWGKCKIWLTITGQWCSFIGQTLTVHLKASSSFSNP